MKTTFTKRAIRSSLKWSRNLRNFAGLAMLAAMLPFTTGYGQPQKPDEATGADVPAATKTEIAQKFLGKTNRAFSASIDQIAALKFGKVRHRLGARHGGGAQPDHI